MQSIERLARSKSRLDPSSHTKSYFTHQQMAMKEAGAHISIALMSSLSKIESSFREYNARLR